MALPIKNFLPAIIHQKGWKLQLLSQWASIVGTLESKMCIKKINETQLIIGVYDASWLQELYYLSSILLKTINEKLEKSTLTAIKFVHIQKKIISVDSKPKFSKKTPEKCTLITLTEKEKYALEKIKDENLKEALHTFLSRCHFEKLNR